MKTEQSTTFQMYLSKFFRSYLSTELGVSPNTIRSYAYTFRSFVEYLYGEKHIRAEAIKFVHFNRQSVNDYLDFLQEVQHVSDRTRNVRLAALCSFARFMQYEDVQHIDQWQNILRIKKKKVTKPTVDHLSIQGIRTLFNVIPTNTKRGFRHLTLLSLMYETGARAQEIADLTPSNLRMTKPYQVVLMGKGGKSRIVPIQDEQFTLLDRYLKDNHFNCAYDNQRPLFFNGMGKKITTTGIAFILQKYISEAHKMSPDVIPQHLSPHGLRHSRAMHLLQAGVSLIYIRDLLGHASIKTTEIYARADSAQKREAIGKAYEKVIPDNAIESISWEDNHDLISWLDALGH